MTPDYLLSMALFSDLFSIVIPVLDPSKFWSLRSTSSRLPDRDWETNY